MSSVESRIIIEHYENGGFGLEKSGYKEKMGLNKLQVLQLMIKWLVERE